MLKCGRNLFTVKRATAPRPQSRSKQGHLTNKVITHTGTRNSTPENYCILGRAIQHGNI